MDTDSAKRCLSLLRAADSLLIADPGDGLHAARLSMVIEALDDEYGLGMRENGVPPGPIPRGVRSPSLD